MQSLGATFTFVFFSWGKKSGRGRPPIGARVNNSDYMTIGYFGECHELKAKKDAALEISGGQVALKLNIFFHKSYFRKNATYVKNYVTECNSNST